MTIPLFDIESGEHCLVVGQTGSGKSVCLQHLIRQSIIAPVFILDSKIDPGFMSLARPDETTVIISGGILEFEKYIKKPVYKMADYIVIRPPTDEIEEPFLMDKYLLLIHNHIKTKCLIVVDELYMIHRNGRSGPGLNAALTRGRSKGHNLLGATQRPAWVSQFCISEPTHYFIFRLLKKEDRARFGHIGFPKNLIIDKFKFYRFNSKAGGEFCEPLSISKRYNESFENETRWI